MTVKRWFIVTNTDNLKFFYDCGMIVDKQAFPNNSYMHDMQAERPKGFLPCFSMDNLSNALESAKSDDQNLITCLVEIDLKCIKFKQLYAQIRESNISKFESVSEERLADCDVIEVLLPAPLPLSYIKKVFLSDAKVHKMIVKEFSSGFGVFPPTFFNHKEKDLFKYQQLSSNDLLEADQCPKIVRYQDVPSRELNYTKAFAYGGALTLSFYQTKNGRFSSKLFEAFASNELDKDEYNHLRPLVSWVFDNENENELASFYSLIFDLAASEADLGTVRYDLLELFEDKKKLPPEFAHVSGLAFRLRQIVERTYEEDLDTYFTKLINVYESKVEGYSKRFLLISMIFIRDHSETLLKFYHDEFTEEDYFLLAIFFGLIKGISTIPLEIRKIEGLRDWVSFKMAGLMHSSNPSSIVFDKELSFPTLIHKKYMKKSSLPKMQDALQKFCSYIGINEEEVLTWTLAPKNEYKVKSGFITFSKRPALYVEIDNESFENLMLVKSIKEMDELFNFNKVFNILKG